jgi:hypothetical protein
VPAPVTIPDRTQAPFQDDGRRSIQPDLILFLSAPSLTPLDLQVENINRLSVLPRRIN